MTGSRLLKKAQPAQRKKPSPGGPGPDQIWRVHDSCCYHGYARTAPQRPLPWSGPASCSEPQCSSEQPGPLPARAPQCGAPGGGLLLGTLLSLFIYHQSSGTELGMTDDGLGSRSCRGVCYV